MAIIVPYRQQAEATGIPGYRQQLRPVEAQATAELGQGIGQGLGALGQGAQHVAAAIQREVDADEEAVRNDRWAKVAALRQDLLDNPDTGLVSQRGEAAAKAGKTYTERFQAGIAQITKDISPGAAKKLKPLLEQEQRAFVGAVNRHVGSEADTLRTESLKAALGAASSDVVRMAINNDLGGAGEALGNIDGALDTTAKANGLPAKVAEQLRSQARTQAVLGAADALLEQGDAQGARYFLERHRAGLDEAMIARSNIERSLAAGTRADEAKALAAKVWGESKGDPEQAAALLQRELPNDPGMQAEATQHVRSWAGAADGLRRESDSPILSAIHIKMLRGELYDPTSDPTFPRLSVQGQEQVAIWQEAADKEEGRLGREAKNDQTERNKLALATFNALDPDQKRGINVEDFAKTFRASPRFTEIIREGQKTAVKRFQNDNGVSEKEFKSQVENAIKDADLPRPLADLFRKRANAKLEAYRNPDDPSLPPNQDTVAGWLAGFLAEKKHTVNLPIIGELKYRPSTYAFQEPADAAATPAGAPPPRKAAPPGKAWIRNTKTGAETTAPIGTPMTGNWVYIQ